MKASNLPIALRLWPLARFHNLGRLPLSLLKFRTIDYIIIELAVTINCKTHLGQSHKGNWSSHPILLMRGLIYSISSWEGYYISNEQAWFQKSIALITQVLHKVNWQWKMGFTPCSWFHKHSYFNKVLKP